MRDLKWCVDYFELIYSADMIAAVTIYLLRSFGHEIFAKIKNSGLILYAFTRSH